jgi:mannose-6-phosphate isomerase
MRGALRARKDYRTVRRLIRSIWRHEMTRGGLVDGTREFKDRFVGRTLPFLIERGWDWRRGGLIEHVSPDGDDAGTPYRRVMVHARQLYVYATWAARTDDADLAAHADRIFAYMIERFWDHERGGWIENVDLEGTPSGFDKDLYAHAFALFALGAYARALGRSEARGWLDHTFETLEARFRRPDGSYSDRMSRDFEDLASDRRSQNPHMHLLEAALSNAEAGGGATYRDLAERLLALFARAFHASGDNAVLEHLNARFEPHQVDGHRVEPGHHFEWAWLLDWASRVLGKADYCETGAPILERGLATGWDARHAGVFDEIDRAGGAVLLSTKRIWPLLELIKALLVFPNPSAEVDAARALDLLLEKYLAEDGRWTERFNADWTPADPRMPSSTPYHMSMALTELERTSSAIPPSP